MIVDELEGLLLDEDDDDEEDEMSIPLSQESKDF